MIQRNPRRRLVSFPGSKLADLEPVRRLAPEIRRDIRVVAHVLPFKVNNYVVEELIEWEDVPDDPIYRLTFPHRDMLPEEAYRTIARLVDQNRTAAEIRPVADRVRRELNPHPAGQLERNVPSLGSERLNGLQHKYRETVLFFPAQGQTCHAYCGYCFRWAQFVGMSELKQMSRDIAQLEAYLRANPAVTDVLFTGGDPMVMATRNLERYLEPLLADDFAHVQSLRIGTKALSYWPYRFTTDSDAEDLLRLIERCVEHGRHVAIMAHLTHPKELETEAAEEAVRRLQSAGAVVRSQSPLVRHVNDHARAWARMWRRQVALGVVPYYMFVERDTGAKRYYEVPLVEAFRIYRAAVASVSGLARTVRGPSMSADPGKVVVDGVADIAGERALALRFLQARNPAWVGRPFHARYDPEATWLDDLRPAFGEERFFFEEDPVQCWKDRSRPHAGDPRASGPATASR